MGAYYDLAAATPILKEFYDGQLVEDEVYKENPYFALVQKKKEFPGKNYPVPLAYGVQGGGSATFVNAQQNQSPIQYAEFLLTRKRRYQLFTIDNETMEATANDRGAFVEAFTDNVDKAIQSITKDIASDLFRSGTGSIGQVSTTTAISTGVITLQDPTSVVQFEVNQVLQANQSDGGASPRAALGYVISVDRFNGTVTVSSSGFGGAAGTPSGWSTSDYLLVQGNNNATMSGLPAWLNNPSNITSSDNFYGVNRSADKWRLGGGYFSGTQMAIEEAVVDAANLLGREGASPNMAFTNFQSYSYLEKSLGAKVQYTEMSAKGAEAMIAFEGIKINGPKGVITVIPDRNCPAATMYILSMRNWFLRSLGECPKILKYKDSQEALRVTNADALEGRIGMYANHYTNAPGWSAQVALSA